MDKNYNKQTNESKTKKNVKKLWNVFNCIKKKFLLTPKSFKIPVGPKNSIQPFSNCKKKNENAPVKIVLLI